ncbi:hypothetical protein P3W85_06490 [Cupriavidus basilensis]|uniref:Transmembrane protein n=1 Tax=Cupriavidus basilensis TaxID=68895 RepID=A0ABT6AJ18_9BURK|nr:hypothetical protein [Cupriavidus basilensis]MDF3832593.1 hypothetical protein [Cupriavidus basilensis]
MQIFRLALCAGVALAMAAQFGCAAPGADGSAGSGGAAGQPVAAAAVHWQRVHLGSGAQAYDFPVYANHPLDGDLRGIREVIFVQHGLRRNGDDYYAAGAALLRQSRRNPDEVLLLAPNFPGTPDQGKGFGNMPMWTVQGWMGGENAVNAPYSVSSLQVLDDLVGMVTDKARFPAVTRVTVAGHSGGAQLVHRYAVLNNADERIRARGIDLRYAVANPSSYLYFTPERPRGKGFAPYDTALCADYDKYRYGMGDMVPYARGMTGDVLFRRYLQRQVIYLVGSDDNDPNHRVLDKSCGAEAEGPTRLERARGYLRYERHLAGRLGRQRPPIHHRAFEVAGVGHNQERMFGSQCGARAVFGLPETANADGAACRAPQL